MPRQKENLTDKEINGILFLTYCYSKNNKKYWNVKCHCGNTFICRVESIKSNRTKSCGCYKHNLCKTSEYNTWCLMKKRCYNINDPSYDDYGGRGIKVCDNWINDFTNFLKDMGTKPSPKHSIDRIDTNGNYCKDNCKWSIQKEQQRNRRNNVLLTYNNETKTMAEWSESLNISYPALQTRIIKGWSHEKALTTPVRKRKNKN